jgi:putative oxidoreductase
MTTTTNSGTRDRLFASRLAPNADVVPLIVRALVGIILVAVSISKFTRHATLVESFERYGVPAPDLTVYLAGIIELLGGLALIAGLAVRAVGVVVVVHFAVALATAGPVETDLHHVALPSVLLVAVAFLVWSGAGRWSSDERLAARGAPTK